MTHLTESMIREHLTIARTHVDQTAATIALLQHVVPDVIRAAAACIDAIRNGGTIYICGNGGSAADAQHFAAELVNMYRRKDRKPLPAIALTNDTSVLTSIGNDFGAHLIFVKQAQALCRKGDVLIGISTSGTSKNVVEAIKVAKENGAKTIGLTGMTGGTLRELVDVLVAVPSTETPHIQEGHLACYHIMCDLIERECS